MVWNSRRRDFTQQFKVLPASRLIPPAKKTLPFHPSNRHLLSRKLLPICASPDERKPHLNQERSRLVRGRAKTFLRLKGVRKLIFRVQFPNDTHSKDSIFPTSCQRSQGEQFISCAVLIEINFSNAKHTLFGSCDLFQAAARVRSRGEFVGGIVRAD